MPSSGFGSKQVHSNLPRGGFGSKQRYRSLDPLALRKYQFMPPPEGRNSYGKKFPKSSRQVKDGEQLPVQLFEKAILRSVANSDITVIRAETGAGKSTLVPQILAKAGYKVEVTQPRRMSAESIAGYVSKDFLQDTGQTVSFQHGLKQEYDPESPINFLTDAYRLALELCGREAFHENQVLIIDEAHEKNIYIETLLALYKYKKQVLGEPVPKLVIMSATIDYGKVYEFFNEGIPEISVPGRTFPVTEVNSQKPLNDCLEYAVKRKWNTLVFLPGKPEIHQVKNRMEAKFGDQVENLPLHSGLSSENQQKCLESYDKTKILYSTNVAEASITIPDIDYVIMSGLVKRIKVNNGVECLTLMPYSRFNFEQQKGRAGRTKPGFYTYCGETPLKSLEKEPPPEIQNSLIDGLILRLINSRFFKDKNELERLEFINPVSQEQLEQSFADLKRLNLVGPRGHITETGKYVASLPVSTSVGKFLFTANSKSTAWNDEDILRYAIDVAAVLTNGSIGKRECKSKWQNLCYGYEESDALAQANLLMMGLHMNKEEIEANGLDPVSIARSRDLRKVLSKRFRLPERACYSIDEHVKREVLESLLEGMINSVFRIKKGLEQPRYSLVDHENKHLRRLDTASILNPYASEVIVGIPFDIYNYTDPERPEIDRVIHMATRVEPEWLARQPKLIRRKLIEGNQKRRGNRGYYNWKQTG